MPRDDVSKKPQQTEEYWGGRNRGLYQKETSSFPMNQIAPCEGGQGRTNRRKGEGQKKKKITCTTGVVSVNINGSEQGHQTKIVPERELGSAGGVVG